MPKDLLYPSQADEKRKHKLKRLIQFPNSFFMDVKCPGCFHITTVFSHAQVRTTDVAIIARLIIKYVSSSKIIFRLLYYAPAAL